MALILTKDRTVWPDGFGKPTAVEPAGTVSYLGAVLATGSETVRIMSDVWADGYFARVWTGTAVVKVSTGNGEFGSDIATEVDATPEVIAAANEWLLAVAVSKLRADYLTRIAKAADDAKRVAKGKTVVVARGRKVPKGTTGEVFWFGEGRYGWRAGLKDAAGTVHWTAASNLDVVNPASYAVTIEVPSDTELTARATRDLNDAADNYKRWPGNAVPGWFMGRAA